jgi:hypothetical protein
MQLTQLSNPPTIQRKSNVIYPAAITERRMDIILTFGIIGLLDLIFASIKYFESEQREIGCFRHSCHIYNVQVLQYVSFGLVC